MGKALKFEMTEDNRIETTDTEAYSNGMYKFFRRSLVQNISGQVLSSAFLVAFSWNYADHNSLLLYLALHQISLLALIIAYVLPWTNKRRTVDGIPKFVLPLSVVTQCIVGSALWFDMASAQNYIFAVNVLIILYACSAGALVTIGPIRRLSRIALFCTLLPCTVAILFSGHYILGIGTVCFLVLVALNGVRDMHTAYAELISLRVQSTQIAQQFEALANRDQLTGLFNRAGIVNQFESKKQVYKYALFIDLDKFKQVNDEAGHLTGDILLQKAAKRLENKVAELGTLSRLGGDEFLILLYKTNSQNLQDFAQSVITVLEQPFTISGGEFSISASVGVSKISAKSTLEQVLKESDDAMYLAKRTGRAKVMFFGDDVYETSEQELPVLEEPRRVDWSHTQF